MNLTPDPVLAWERLLSKAPAALIDISGLEIFTQSANELFDARPRMDPCASPLAQASEADLTTLAQALILSGLFPDLLAQQFFKVSPGPALIARAPKALLTLAPTMGFEGLSRHGAPWVIAQTVRALTLSRWDPLAPENPYRLPDENFLTLAGKKRPDDGAQPERLLPEGLDPASARRAEIASAWRDALDEIARLIDDAGAPSNPSPALERQCATLAHIALHGGGPGEAPWLGSAWRAGMSFEPGERSDCLAWLFMRSSQETPELARERLSYLEDLAEVAQEAQLDARWFWEGAAIASLSSQGHLCALLTRKDPSLFPAILPHRSHWRKAPFFNAILGAEELGEHASLRLAILSGCWRGALALLNSPIDLHAKSFAPAPSPFGFMRATRQEHQPLNAWELAAHSRGHYLAYSPHVSRLTQERQEFQDFSLALLSRMSAVGEAPKARSPQFEALYPECCPEILAIEQAHELGELTRSAPAPIQRPRL